MEEEDRGPPLTPEETHGCCYISTQMLHLKLENQYLRKQVQKQQAIIRFLLKKEDLSVEPSVLGLAGSWDGDGETIQVLDVPEDIKIGSEIGADQLLQGLDIPRDDLMSDVVDGTVEFLNGLDFLEEDVKINVVEQADPLQVQDFPEDDIMSSVTDEGVQDEGSNSLDFVVDKFGIEIQTSDVNSS
jgi:hypothetical protein